MSHVNNDAGDNKPAAAADNSHAHASALHQDAYNPSHLNEFKYSSTGAVDKASCLTGPKLSDLTIDVSKTAGHEKETPTNSDSWAQRKATSEKDLPQSNEHFREIVAKAASQMHEGTFGITMKTALSEAFRSGGGVDKDIHAEFKNPLEKNEKVKPDSQINFKHVDDTLKYMNEALCGSSYTMSRKGHIVNVIDSHVGAGQKPEVGKYNLETKSWEK